MRIGCIVNPEYGSGIGRHICEMVTGLANRAGASVEVVTSPKSLNHNPELQRCLGHLPLRALPFSSRTIERLWKTLRWPRVDRHLSQDCDVVYTPAQTRLPPSRFPTVITIHDIQPFETNLPWSQTRSHRLTQRKWRAWLPQAACEATRVVTVSEFTKQRLVSLLELDPARIGVVGNGVSDVFFRAGRERTYPPNPSVVVVGGLRTKKGASDVLAVTELLASRKSRIQIDIVGANEAEWVTKAGNTPNVVNHGILSDSELAILLARATALLFLSPYEGFGIPAIEAMAAGTPAVVADAASLPEVAGDAGIVINPADHETIADILERLHGDHVWRNTYVTKGYAHAARFTWTACVDHLLQHLRLAIQNGN